MENFICCAVMSPGIWAQPLVIIQYHNNSASNNYHTPYVPEFLCYLQITLGTHPQLKKGLLYKRVSLFVPNLPASYAILGPPSS